MNFSYKSRKEITISSDACSSIIQICFFPVRHTCFDLYFEDATHTSTIEFIASVEIDTVYGGMVIIPNVAGMTEVSKEDMSEEACWATGLHD